MIMGRIQDGASTRPEVQGSANGQWCPMSCANIAKYKAVSDEERDCQSQTVIDIWPSVLLEEVISKERIGSNMKFNFLGTAAYEGIPALFCSCESCKKARQIGGKSIRTRSQAIIDDCLLLDFPADTLSHMLYHGIDMKKIRNCFITHNHSDHLYVDDMKIMREGFAHTEDDYSITYYLTEVAGKSVKDELSSIPKIAVNFVYPFQSVTVDKHTVIPLPAIHSTESGPVIYQIYDNKNRVLYAHDTHFLHDDMWDFWKKEKPYFDLVSLDCTNAMRPMDYIGHMSLEENIEVKERMLEMGVADHNTIFVCNHFSHNGLSVLYEDFEEVAKKEGFLTSYDGLEIIL